MYTPLQKFWAFIHKLGWKDRVYEILRPYGTDSFTHLSVSRQEEVLDYLKSEWEQRSKRPRGTIIHYLCIMPGYDYKTASGEPNYEKIDEWVKSKMENKALNQLTMQQLAKAVSIVKAWYTRQIKS